MSEKLQVWHPLTKETSSPKGTIKTHTTINDKIHGRSGYPARYRADVGHHYSCPQPTTTTSRDFPVIYKNHRQTIIKTPSDTITSWTTFYTDGSQTDDGCGAGSIIRIYSSKTIIYEETNKFSNYCTWRDYIRLPFLQNVQLWAARNECHRDNNLGEIISTLSW